MPSYYAYCEPTPGAWGATVWGTGWSPEAAERDYVRTHPPGNVWPPQVGKALPCSRGAASVLRTRDTPYWRSTLVRVGRGVSERLITQDELDCPSRYIRRLLRASSPRY